MKLVKRAAGKSWISSARFFAFALATLGFDQLTKLIVMHNLPWLDGTPTYSMTGAGKPIEVIPNFFYIVHITNEGAAWGILSGQTYLLTSIAVLALFALWLFRSYLGFNSRLGQAALGMFAGGVIGNLVDRICYGHVVDFLDIHLPLINYRWPAFNVADCGISVGVAIYILMIIFEDYSKKSRKA